ncbi:MAG: sialidase family protein, partial [Candidatus Hodarchaeota archaeon]
MKNRIFFIKFILLISILSIPFIFLLSIISNSSINPLFPVVDKKSLDLSSSNWSNASVISDIYGWNNGSSYNPKIVTDKNGNLHVVWHDETAGEWGTDTEIMYANYTAAGWSNATVISDIYGWNDGLSFNPSIATDKVGNLHVVWYDSTNGEWGTDLEIMYVNYTTNGWSNATVISDVYGWNNGASYYPRIATDNNGNIHVVWYDDTNGEWGTDTEIMYVNYTGAIWSNATVISDVYGWNNDSSMLPTIATDNGGNIHVVWRDETNGEWGMDEEIMYANYTVAGWSNATVISDDYTGWNNDYSYQPEITIDNNGNLHVVWYDNTDGEWGTDEEIMYVNYTASGWSNASVISDVYGWNNNYSLNPSIVSDSNGNIHIMWQDRTAGEWGTDYEIMYTNNTGMGWSNATCISDLYGWNNDDSWYPSIATDDNGNIHVVWQDYTAGEWGIDIEIMYTNKTSNFPNIISVLRDPLTPGNLDTVNITVHVTDDVEVDTVLLNSNHTAIQEDHLMNFLSG